MMDDSIIKDIRAVSQRTVYQLTIYLRTGPFEKITMTGRWDEKHFRVTARDRNSGVQYVRDFQLAGPSAIRGLLEEMHNATLLYGAVAGLLKNAMEQGRAPTGTNENKA